MKIERLAYSSDGTVHVIPADASTWVDEAMNEKNAALCGGNFPGGRGPPCNGMRLTDEFLRGSVCETCLGLLRENDVTVPGFLSDGELVGEAERKSSVTLD